LRPNSEPQALKRRTLRGWRHDRQADEAATGG